MADTVPKGGEDTQSYGFVDNLIAVCKFDEKILLCELILGRNDDKTHVALFQL